MISFLSQRYSFCNLRAETRHFHVFFVVSSVGSVIERNIEHKNKTSHTKQKERYNNATASHLCVSLSLSLSVVCVSIMNGDYDERQAQRTFQLVLKESFKKKVQKKVQKKFEGKVHTIMRGGGKIDNFDCCNDCISSVSDWSADVSWKVYYRVQSIHGFQTRDPA